jgi:CRISPR-associated protein Cas2
MLYVITYDITHKKRLYRIAKTLEGWGYRVQDSVFECWLQPGELKKLQKQLHKIANPVFDKIHYYPLCGKDQGQIKYDGFGSSPAAPESWII